MIMKKKIILVLLTGLLGLNSFGQVEDIVSKKDWKVKAALSFAPGLLTEKTKTIQLQGTFGFV